MRMFRFSCGFALLLCALTFEALAVDTPKPATAPPSHVVATPVAVTVAAAKPAAVDGLGIGVSGSALAQQRGGTQVTETMTLTGSVDHNTDNQVVTGSNVIDGNAFSGAAGVPMAIQNSGNNVLIQNATIINVQFHP